MSTSRSHGERLKGTLSGCGSLSHTSQQSRYTSTMSNPLTDECGSMMSGYVPTTTPSTSYDPDPVEGSYDGRYVACSMPFMQPYSTPCAGGVAGVRVNPRGTSVFSSTEEDTEGEGEREGLMISRRGDVRRGGETMYNEYGESEAFSDGVDLSDLWDDASQAGMEEEEEQEEEVDFDDFDVFSEEDDDFMEMYGEACEDNDEDNDEEDDEEDDEGGSEKKRAEWWNHLDSVSQELHWRNLFTRRPRSSSRCPSPPPSPRARESSWYRTCCTRSLYPHYLPTSYTPYEDDLHAPFKRGVDPTARAGKRGNGSKNRLLTTCRRRGGGGDCQTYADAASAAAMVPRHGYGRVEDDLCGGIRWIPFDDTDCFYYDHPRRSPLRPSAELLDEFGPPFDM